MNQVVELRHGRQRRLGGVLVGMVGLARQPDQTWAARLHVTVGSSEQEYRLRVGEQFTGAEQTWRVLGIDDPEDHQYVVRIERIDEPQAAPQVASPERATQLRRRWEPSEQEWQTAVEQVERRERDRARELFGDRPPFAIPDIDADPHSSPESGR